MWLITQFEAVTLFSLKMSSATSSGGKTLLVPTPYAIKMAMLDCVFRDWGVLKTGTLWTELRDLQIALQPAPRVVVTNLFQKVLRPRRNPAGIGDPDTGPFQKTIGYREYALLIGPLGIALGWDGDEHKEWLAQVLMKINYLGKRGSFFQLTSLPEFMKELPDNYIHATTEQPLFMANGTLQILDDCSPSLTFAKVNIYHREKVKSGKDRVFRNIVLPYRVARTSKSFTLYERIEP